MLMKLKVFDYSLIRGSLFNARVELWNDSNDNIVTCNGEKGEALIRSVEEQGEPAGDKEKLPFSVNYSDRSYQQKFSLPVSFSPSE